MRGFLALAEQQSGRISGLIKYIKAALLDNGSLTLTYDHKVMKGEKPQDYVPHIINALDFASNYIIEKIGE